INKSAPIEVMPSAHHRGPEAIFCVRISPARGFSGAQVNILMVQLAEPSMIPFIPTSPPIRYVGFSPRGPRLTGFTESSFLPISKTELHKPCREHQRCP